MAELRWIGVLGPNCVGKSTLTAAMASVPGVIALPEPYPAKEHDDLAAGVPGAGYRLQRAFIESKASAALAIPGSPLLVFDRTLAEDREVFFRIHRYELEDIDDSQLAALDVTSRVLERRLGPPLCIIELTAPLDVLRARFEAVERPAWLAATLDYQLKLYDSMVAYRRAPRIRIDTSVVGRADTAAIGGRLAGALNAATPVHDALVAAARDAGPGVSLSAVAGPSVA